jgi:hypothetical protein
MEDEMARQGEKGCQGKVRRARSQIEDEDDDEDD